MENYIVSIKFSIRNIYYLKCNPDSDLLFKEKKLIIGKPTNINPILILDDKRISPNYFDFIINPETKKNSYFVPIGFHPDLYFLNFWKKDFSFLYKRHKSLFMAGNMGKNYSNEYNENLFSAINRFKISQLINSYGILNRIDVKDEIDFFENVKDRLVYFVEKKNTYQIPPSKLFYFLSRFDFFFAMPGMYMPLSHNLIEAMSVGTIPFLQESYANTFQPQLKNGVDCVTFKGTEDLYERIQYLFSMDSSEVIKLRQGVCEFYLENLSSKSIVSNLLNRSYSKIYLMAEEYSVQQLMLNREI
ncbi:MAG: hypothetical protein ACXIUD_11805 [Mongoliitalea sp.]